MEQVTRTGMEQQPKAGPAGRSRLVKPGRSVIRFVFPCIRPPLDRFELIILRFARPKIHFTIGCSVSATSLSVSCAQDNERLFTAETVVKIVISFCCHGQGFKSCRTTFWYLLRGRLFRLVTYEFKVQLRKRLELDRDSVSPVGSRLRRRFEAWVALGCISADTYLKATKISNCLSGMDNLATVYGLSFRKSQASKQLILGGFKNMIRKIEIGIQAEKIQTNRTIIRETTIKKIGSVVGLGVPLHTREGSSLKKASFAEMVGGASSQSPLIVLDSQSSLPVRKGNLISHPSILTDLARGIRTPLKFDHSTIVGNYGHYARVLVDVDLAGFVKKKLLLETTDDCIEVDLYFELFPDFCTSCHSVGHSMVKCKSVIGKTPPNVGYHGKQKENKASGLTRVYKPKQTPLLHVESTTPSMPTINTFDVLNTDVTPTTIEEIDHQQVAVLFNMGSASNRTNFNMDVGKSIQITLETVQTPSYHSTVPHQVTSWANAFGDSDDESDDDANDIIKDEWPPLQGENPSKPS
ncbi:hypothetical protein FNV43_RR10875 [Rhamnella rubrinervis]|uniref:Zinc knuckle CX2CX4HX4C domain-containing protein n=1 Tax=Rhamnella rubrinervis TaxID=2594499 RepID=A0A8K0MGR0_9ROSA|nr:hypothetical protein FNV43_RR10875 [Rhamnella rubrinervis]